MLKCAGALPLFSPPLPVSAREPCRRQRHGRAFPAERSPYPTVNSQTFCFRYLKVPLNSKPAVGMTSSNRKVSAAKWDLIARGLRYKLMNLNNKTLWGATYGAVSSKFLLIIPQLVLMGWRSLLWVWYWCGVLIMSHRNIVEGFIILKKKKRVFSINCLFLFNRERNTLYRYCMSSRSRLHVIAR